MFFIDCFSNIYSLQRTIAIIIIVLFCIIMIISITIIPIMIIITTIIMGQKDMFGSDLIPLVI